MLKDDIRRYTLAALLLVFLEQLADLGNFVELLVVSLKVILTLALPVLFEPVRISISQRPHGLVQAVFRNDVLDHRVEYALHRIVILRVLQERTELLEELVSLTWLTSTSS